MPGFAIMSGPLGSGKTLAAVGLVSDYLAEGRKVATNIDIAFSNFKNQAFRCQCMRVNDIPTARDLKAIGLGHDGERPDEERNGLLILDEAALWLNARSWNDKWRKDVIAWFVHARKLRWDVVIVVQSETVLDKSVVNMFGEYSIKVMNLSKIKMPFVGWIGKLTRGRPFMLPKVHKATWFYNGSGSSLKQDTRSYTGKDVYHLFDTEQGFGHLDERGTYSFLSPWHLKGRYASEQRSSKSCFRLVLLLKFPLYVYCEALRSWGLLVWDGRQYVRPMRKRSILLRPRS